MRVVQTVLGIGILLLMTCCGGTSTTTPPINPVPDTTVPDTTVPDTTVVPDIPPSGCVGNAECDDSNPCTDDMCVAGSCESAPNTAGCDDGDVCTVQDTCQATTCVGQPMNCDDANVCTKDYCWEGNCTNVVLADPECALGLTITSPARAAEINGVNTVLVKGAVSAPAGKVDSLTIGGSPVTVESDGSFSHAVSALPGLNIIQAAVNDEYKRTVTAAQSFAYGEVFHEPGTFSKPSAIPGGAVFWLGKGFFDDNDTSDLDDLATLVWKIMETLDGDALLNACNDPNKTNCPIATQKIGVWTYKIYVSDLEFSVGSVNITPKQGGLTLEVVLDQVSSWVEATADWAPDCSGPVTMNALKVTGQFDVSVRSGAIDVVLDTATVAIEGLDVTCQGGALSLVNFIIDLFQGTLKNKLEDSLEDMMSSQIAPILETALDTLSSYTMAFDIPGIPGGAAVSLKVGVDVDAVNVSMKGASLSLDGAVAPLPKIEHPSAGSVGRGQCGLTPNVGQCCTPTPQQSGCATLQACEICVCGIDSDCCDDGWGTECVNQAVTACANACSCSKYEPESVALPQTGLVEVALRDDLTNQILHALWRGGYMSLTLTDTELAPYLGSYGVSGMTLTIDPHLPPTVTTCTPSGAAEVQLGDFAMQGTFQLNGNPATFWVWASIRAGMQVHVIPAPGGPSQIGGEVTDVLEFAVQVENTEGLGALGDTLLDVIMTEVVSDYLLSDLLTGMAAAYPIPAVDLGAIVPGMSSGSEVTFSPNSLEWKPGYLELRGVVVSP